MATARATLAAEHRDLTGKKVARLRHAGRLPAVVYGHGIDSSSVSIDAHDFEQLRRHTGPNALVDLSIDGAKAQPVLVSAIQVHPVNRRTLHVDLFLVRMTEELTVDVPLVAIGESEAVSTHGGTLLHPIESVRVRALPDHLPQSIEYSIEALNDFIAKVQAPRVEEEPTVVGAAEAAEGEAAEAGEAAAEGGESDSGDSSEG